MGKAIITSNEGEGLYLVDYIYNTTALDARIAQLNLRITEIEAVEIPAMEAAITGQEATIAATISDINAAIVAENEEVIITLTARRNEESAVIASLKSQIAAKKGEALSVNQQIIDLNAKRKASESVSAWCTDYNIDLAIGLEVGVMEFPGEAPGVSQPVIIRPGGINGDENGFINDDGMMTQSIAMSPAQLYYMQGIMPGWQRWVPIYRLGTLGLIDTENDKCIVFMDNNVSSYQGLDTIPEGNLTLTDVPIEYLNCNSAVFETDDKVIVLFDPAGNGVISSHGNYTGTVIGFQSEPRPCVFFRFKVYSVAEELITADDVEFEVLLSTGSTADFSAEYRTVDEVSFWELTINTKDPEGYFISYYDKRDIYSETDSQIPAWTQYPGICEESEKKKPEDLYKGGDINPVDVDVIFKSWGLDNEEELEGNWLVCNGFFQLAQRGVVCYSNDKTIKYELTFACFAAAAGTCDELEMPADSDCADPTGCPSPETAFIRLGRIRTYLRECP